MNQQKIYKFVCIIGLFAVSVLAHGTVQAHEVTPKTSQPEPGKALAASPEEVVLTFPEEIVEKGSSLAVFNPAGQAVDLGNGGVDLNDVAHITLRVKLPRLEQGVYEVRWKIILTDGDESSGSYHFGVGNVTVPTEAVHAAEETSHSEDESPQPEQTGNASLPMPMIAVGAGLLVLVIAAGLFMLIARRHK
jgi:copper resistance protein C